MNDLQYVDLDDTFSCYIPQNRFAGAGEAKFIYAEIFHNNCYLREGITLHDTAFVLDIGANVGLFSLYVKAKYPQAYIMAFEPIPDIYRALRVNLEHHKVDGVCAIEQALGAKWEPEVAFTFYRDMPGNSTRYPALKERGRKLLAEAPESFIHQLWGEGGLAVADRLLQDKLEIRLSVKRFSDVLAAHPTPQVIDLVKIDVEGAERDILMGIDDTDWRRIRQLAVEVHNRDSELAMVRNLLESKGFTVAIPDSALSPLQTHTVYARRS